MYKPIWITSIFWTIYYSIHSITKFTSFNSWAFDLGIYTNTVYQYSQGKLAFSDIIQMHMLANNFEPILALISPLYKAFPSPIALLLFQSLSVGASVYFIHLCIEKITSQKYFALIITNLYASSVGILYAISYDFHPTLISVLPLSLILYAYFANKPKLYWISVIFSILYRQDVPIFIAGIGIYQILTNRFKIGMSSLFFALSIFSIIQFIILPKITVNPDNQYSGITRFQTSQIDITKPLQTLTMLYSPEIKIQNTFLLYSQYLFFPLGNLLAYFTVVPYLLLRYTSSYSNTWTYTVQYNANLEPFLAISSALFLTKIHIYLKTKTVHIQKIVITSFITLAIFIKLPIILNFFLMTYSYIQLQSQYTYIYSAFEHIPESVPISAQSEFVSHLANREHIYIFPQINDAQYVILDHKLSSANWEFDEQKTGMYTKETYTKIADDFIDPGKWQTIYQNGSVQVFKKI